MKHVLAPVAALLISVSILLAGQGLQGTLLPVRASLESFPTLAIGIMGAAYFLGFTFGCVRGGELVQRVGHVRVFLAMTALASAAPLLHGLVLNPVAWGLLRALTGFCFAVLYIVIESWLNESSSNENRGTVFSVYVMITLTVLAAGQMMTLLYDPAGLELFLIASVLVSLGAIPVALSLSPSPELPTTVKLDIRRVLRISPTGTIGCLAVGLANGAFWSLAPVFTGGISSDTSLAAWFMSMAVIGGALSQWPLGYFSDQFGRRKIMIGATLIGVIVAASILLSGDDPGFWGVNFFGAAWGAVAFPLYAIAVAHANDHAEPEDYVMVSSGLLLMYGTGAIAGPFVASLLMSYFGAFGLFGFTAIVHGLLAVFIVLRTQWRASVPDEKHIPFSDALATAHTASQVYEEEYQQSVEADDQRD
ncbi:MAG: MFS transporter [Gammaproteobacteria bacterium]|nr:MFS transporter [Gammaproteobacteria bacterium]MDH3433954.1 MFS transporter [Gammaproteobacteria bacterium]